MPNAIPKFLKQLLVADNQIDNLIF